MNPPSVPSQVASALQNSIFGPLQHIGIVTPNTAQTQASLSQATGVTWYTPQSFTLPLTIAPGFGTSGTYTDSVVLSRGGVPHLEVVGAVPNTFFNATGDHPIFELGYVTGQANLKAASDMLAQAGTSFVATLDIPGSTPDNPAGVVWRQIAPGFLIELLADDPTPTS